MYALARPVRQVTVGQPTYINWLNSHRKATCKFLTGYRLPSVVEILYTWLIRPRQVTYLYELQVIASGIEAQQHANGVDQPFAITIIEQDRAHGVRLYSGSPEKPPIVSTA